LVDVDELRATARTLRGWAEEISLESSPAPYATSTDVIAVLENAARSLEDAAKEIEALRAQDLSDASVDGQLS